MFFFTKPKHERHTWACFAPPLTLSTYSTTEDQSSFLPMILNVPQPLHHPPPNPPFAQVTLNDVSVTSLDQCDVPWAPSFEADSLSSQTSLNCGQVNWFHPSRLTFHVWLLQHGCFPTDVDQSSATFSCSVFISTFLKREASKWEGLLSYFSPTYLFLTVFQWKPMCLVWPTLPFFFLNGIRIVVDLKSSFFFFFFVKCE